MPQEAFQQDLRYFARVGNDDGYNGFVDLDSLIDYLQHKEVTNPLTNPHHHVYNFICPNYPVGDCVTLFYGFPKQTSVCSQIVNGMRYENINLSDYLNHIVPIAPENIEYIRFSLAGNCTPLPAFDWKTQGF